MMVWFHPRGRFSGIHDDDRFDIICENYRDKTEAKSLMTQGCLRIWHDEREAMYACRPEAATRRLHSFIEVLGVGTFGQKTSEINIDANRNNA